MRKITMSERETVSKGSGERVYWTDLSPEQSIEGSRGRNWRRGNGGTPLTGMFNLLIQLRTTWSGLAPFPVTWAFPYQSLSRKTALTSLTYKLSDEGIFPMKLLFTCMCRFVLTQPTIVPTHVKMEASGEESSLFCHPKVFTSITPLQLQ